MDKTVKETIHAQGIEIGIYTTDFENEFISLTDIAKYRNEDDPRFVIQNWMRNRNTIEFLGVWETLHNPNFNRVQFDTVKNEAGANRFVMTPTKWPELTPAQKSFVYADEADLLNVALFGQTAKEWRKENPGKKGNIRDYTDLHHLLVLSNLESYNAILIEQNLPQNKRLELLRETALKQLKTIMGLDFTSQKLLTINESDGAE